MTMIEPSKPGIQQNTTADYVTAATRAVFGAVPVAGSLLAEIVGTIIPNQRTDRIADFALKLDQRIAVLDAGFIRAQLRDENFTDLMEEGVRQAARAVTDERRQHLVNLIANGLESSSVNHIESKHLLKMLGELNEVEVIRLRFYAVPGLGRADIEFRTKHRSVIARVDTWLRAPQSQQDAAAMQRSYDQHLERLGLVVAEYQEGMPTGSRRFQLEIGGYWITALGKLLLRHIGLLPDDADPRNY